jgi:hypothetical protein
VATSDSWCILRAAWARPSRRCFGGTRGALGPGTEFVGRPTSHPDPPPNVRRI